MQDFFAELGRAFGNWWLELELSEKAPQLLISLIIAIFGIYLARLVKALVQRGFQRRKSDPEIAVLLSRIVQWGIISIAVLVAAQQVGLDITTFLAGLGILGFTVGFALQDVSKNFVAGMLLLLQQPFELGDTVEVAGFTGTVIDINLRDTEMRTADGLRVRIPNGDVFTSPILNYTGVRQRRIQISFGVSFDSDLAAVQRATLETLSAVPGVLGDPEIDFRFESFGEILIKASVYYWYSEKQTTYSKALHAGITAVQKALKAVGAEIPLAPHDKLKLGETT